MSGYVMIDFQGITLSTTPVTIDGIYKRIIDGKQKPFVLCNLKHSGTSIFGNNYSSVVFGADQVDFCFVSATQGGSQYVARLSATDEDAVTWTETDVKNA